MPTTVPLYPSSFNARLPTPSSRKRRNPRVVSVPEHATPVVRLVFSEIARQMQTLEELEEGSGVRRASVKAWKRKNRPNLESVQAVLAFLGWDFVPVPCLETLPAELAADLVELARRAETTIPNVWREALNVAVEQRVVGMKIAERRAIFEQHHARIANRPRAARHRRPAATVQ